MSPDLATFEARATAAFRRHLREGSESSLHEAYEFGRAALDAGLGVIDMAVLVSRAARRSESPANREADQRTESFLLECLAPFEMAHGAMREANAALRQLDQQRELDARRIAADLHDHAGQILPVLGFMIDGLRGHLPPSSVATVDQARALIEQLAERLRRLSHELRPIILDDLGLEPALRHLAEGVMERSGIAIRVDVSRIGRFEPTIETVVYRAVQEALRNVVRHAGATRAVVELRRGERELVCRVIDDGHGFPPGANGAPPGSHGIGLDAMRERVAGVRGRIELNTGPMRGAEITIRIPLEMRRAHTIASRG